MLLNFKVQTDITSGRSNAKPNPRRPTAKIISFGTDHICLSVAFGLI